MSLVTERIEDGILYLELNGFGFSGDISGTGTLYLMDTSGDAYELPTGRIIGRVSCKLATDVKVNAKRYLVLADETGYTSHRIYVGLTHMSLQPATTGVGYKAVFAGDSAVQALLAQEEAFGFTLWVGEGEKQTFAKGAAAFESGKTMSLRLQNFNVADYGEVPVYGQVFMKLADGTVIPCCLDHEGDIPLGNLLKEELKDILAGERAKGIYEGFSCRRPTEELCRRCGYASRFNRG